MCTSSRAGTLIIAQLVIHAKSRQVLFFVPAAQDLPSESPLTVKAEVKAPPAQPTVKEPVGQVSWISEIIIKNVLAQSESGKPNLLYKIFEGQT